MQLGTLTQHRENDVGTLRDVPVTVIDTPAFFEKDRSNNKSHSVQEDLKTVTVQEHGPHAFLLVVPPAPMTREVQDTNALIETMLRLFKTRRKPCALHQPYTHSLLTQD